jgi:site-specific recombinase XerD
MKNYIITPEDFMSRKERQQLMKICKEHSELDLIKGRQTWPIRYMLVDLALYSGFRVSEMAALKVGDLVFNESDPFIIVRHGKGNKKRTVYIDQKLAKHLKEFINYKAKTLNQAVDMESPLFSGRDGKHSPPITLMKSFKQAIEVAGLPDRYSIHKARHTYATYLLHDTGNLRYVMQQLGHSDISMTTLYANILPEENGHLANKILRDE